MIHGSPKVTRRPSLPQPMPNHSHAQLLAAARPRPVTSPVARIRRSRHSPIGSAAGCDPLGRLDQGRDVVVVDVDRLGQGEVADAPELIGRARAAS